MSFVSKLFDKYKNISLPAKASIWFMFSSVVTRGISFITTPFFTRLLTTEEYGVASLYNTWQTIITIFATFELATGVFNKAMIKYENDRDGYTSSSLFLSSILTASVFLIYIIGKSFWNSKIELSTSLMVMMFTDIFFTSAWSFFSIRDRFDFKYRTIVIVTIASNALATILSLILVANVDSNKVEAKVFGSLIIRVSIYLIFYIKIFCKGKKLVEFSYWKYSLGYNLPLVPHYLSQQVLNQSDRIMISKMCGDSDAGLYSLAYQLAITMQIVTNAIHASFVPWMYQRIKANDLKSIGKRSMQFIISIGTICVLFSLFAPELILILGGTKYHTAVYVVPPVSMSILFLTIYSFISGIEFYFERTKFVMVASCVVAASNILLNYIFIKIFGFVAAGYTTLFCYICYSIVHYIFMKHVCKQENIEDPFPAKLMWSIAAFYAIVSIFISFVYDYLWVRYSLIVALTIVAFIYFKKNKQSILGK